MPTQIGNYSAVFVFPGETLTGSLGNPGNPNLNANVGDVYGASTSNVVTFTVSSSQLYSLIPENPLPQTIGKIQLKPLTINGLQFQATGSEHAPVEFGNTGDFNFAGNYNPYTTAPLTGHIVWSQPLVPGSPGGQLGGNFGGTAESNYYSGFQYQPKFCPIIMNGVLYYQAMPNYNAITQGFVALDLRSGHTLWTKNYLNFFANGSQDTLLCGQIYIYKTMNTYGAQSYLWATRTTAGITFLDMFDAATGNYILSISGAGGGGSFGRQNFEAADGSLLQLYLNSSVVGGSMRQSLTLWNSSHCINPTDNQFFSMPQNGVIAYNQGVMWSVLLPNQTSTGAQHFPTGSLTVQVTLAGTQTTTSSSLKAAQD